MPTTVQLESEVERLSVAIKAAEDWAPSYAKDPETHGALIKNMAKMESALRGYQRGLKSRVNTYINWSAYSMQILKQQQAKKAHTILAAANVDVTIFDPDGDIDDEDDLFSQTIHDTVLAGIAIGAKAGENIYGTSLGLSASSQAIQEAAQS